MKTKKNKSTIIYILLFILISCLIFVCGSYFGMYVEQERKPMKAEDYLEKDKNFTWDGERAKKAEPSKNKPKIRKVYEAYCGLSIPFPADGMKEGLLDNTEHNFKSETEERYLLVEKDIPADVKETEGKIKTFHDKDMIGIRKIVRIGKEDVLIEYAGFGNYDEIQAEFELLTKTMKE